MPFISTDDMREVDRAMIEDYGIALMQMMENAGRCLAILARDRFLDGDPRGRPVTVLAGRGGNGGGGLVAARCLHAWGAEVRVSLSAPADGFIGVPAHQLSILRAMGVDVDEGPPSGACLDAELMLDALIGYSLRGAPAGAAEEMIRLANGSDAPVLALDVPSGIDTGTGTAHEPSINAAAAMTLALPKGGLRSEAARGKVGEVYLADIGGPTSLYERPPLSLDVGPVFARGDILRLW